MSAEGVVPPYETHAGVRLAPRKVDTESIPGGGMILRSPLKLGDYPLNICAHLLRWAGEAGDRTFLAERASGGEWKKVSYAEALREVLSLAEGLLDMGLTPDRPVMVLSENSINFGLLQLASMYVGIPVAPVSPAYSLLSRDHEKLRHVFETVKPGLLYASDGKAYGRALNALDLKGVRVIVETGRPDNSDSAFFDELKREPGPQVEKAYSLTGPDTVAKILFTSGSTDLPKGVINTQRMLTASQESIAKVWPFLLDHPPVLLDWLPWNHTFGGNKSFNMVLRNGGTLYIDQGKPVPGLIEKTVANLREVNPTISFNVPKGYDALLPYLERDEEVRKSFFGNMDMIFYAAAALPQNLWERLEKLAVGVKGGPVFMASGWGATETSPTITMVHYPIDRAGVIGLPMPGFEVKLLPEAEKYEMRVRGPNVTPGYYGRPDLTAGVFDEEGFYKIGDAGKLADPGDPSQGLVFDGRVTEDFKLTTGTWVSVGNLRVGLIGAAAPLIQDAVITGHNRDHVGLLLWPNLAECGKLDPEAGPDAGSIIKSPKVTGSIRAALGKWNASATGSATRIGRALLLAEPPDMDLSEITDKGYINQRAVLTNRAALVEKLYSTEPGGDVIIP